MVIAQSKDLIIRQISPEDAEAFSDMSKNGSLEEKKMNYATRLITIEDYDDILKLWNSTEQTRRAMNPVDDTREGIV